ncbi:MAG: type IV pilus assembly protein PilM [Chthoniobacterales bacterium]
MAAANRFFALDLGMQTVKLAEFRVLPQGGLSLVALHETELIVDPAADATRSEQLKLAVEELKTAAGFKAGEKVNICLPSQSVFTRFVKLPGATPEDVRSVINFEAQQNVPFPIDEVVWDYQIMGEAKEGNWDVVLVAIKADQLSATNDAVQASGLRTDAVDVAPMALYNCFRFNYPDYTGTSMIIDIGARTTNLIFVNGDKAFSRSIPIGGNTITAAIQKELEGEMLVAERLKKEKGFVGLGGAYAEPTDPTEAKISKLIRNTLTRLHADITRSISFYRANQDGSQPLRVLLCGGTVSFPSMVEFFNEKLQMPVEFLNPFRNIAIEKPDVAQLAQDRVHSLGELVGVGIRALEDSPLEINLRPASLLQQQDLEKRKPILIAATVCGVAALSALGFYYQQAAGIQEQVNQQIITDTNSLDGLSKKIKAARDSVTKLAAENAPLLLANQERFVWRALVDELAKAVPERFVWITKLTPLSNGNPIAFGEAKELTAGKAPTRPGRPTAPNRREQAKPSSGIDALQIRGLYLDNDAKATVIDQFVERLAQSPLFSIDSSNRSEIVSQRSTVDGQTWAYSYELVLPLKNPIPLK